MKDKEARKQLNDLSETIHGSFKNEGMITYTQALRGVSIKDCPKCNHPVMAQRIEKDKITHTTCSITNLTFNDSSVLTEQHSYYRCLTCGSTIRCSQECVCKIVEER